MLSKHFQTSVGKSCAAGDARTVGLFARLSSEGITRGTGIPGRQSIAKRLSRRALFYGLMGLLVIAGCGRGTDQIAAVDGQILFMGLPARASITSQAVDEKNQPQGRPSLADTRTDGTFTLNYSEDRPGALVGKHTVTISIFPVERAVGEFDFQQRFRPVKVVQFQREVSSTSLNHWNFVLTY